MQDTRLCASRSQPRGHLSVAIHPKVWIRAGWMLLLAGSVSWLRAQVMPREGPGLDGIAADRVRVSRLLGRDSLSVAIPPLGTSGQLLASELRIVSNSSLPYSLNDGVLWAGRGFNASMTPAGQVVYRTESVAVRLVAAPTFSYSQNRPFQIFPGRDPSRSTFSSPWHSGATSADLPLRFGDEPIHTLDWGQSSLRIALPTWTVGVGTQNEWWGPGIRSTLVMSNNAQGIPHLFLQPTHPRRTGVGTFDGRFLAGALTKSRFFDTIAASNYRSISAAVVTFRPRADSGLLLGISRAVYRPIASAGGSLAHAADVITQWQPIAPPADTLANGSSRQRTDQITSLFARWEFPSGGFEVYGELARVDLPRGLHDWLVAPYHSQGYIVGTQFVRPISIPQAVVRAQAEFLDVEQSAVFRDRPPVDFYTGRISPQGFTQRGQIIGAATGPGSSTQWLAADVIAPRWQAGVFVGRTRWENDVLYRLPAARLTQHDVTVFSGLRGGFRSRWTDVLGELTVGRRLNYLFQNEAVVLGEEGAVSTNVQNVTLAILLCRADGAPGPRR